MTILICRHRYSMLAGPSEDSVSISGAHRCAGVIIPSTEPLRFHNDRSIRNLESAVIHSVAFLCERDDYIVTNATLTHVLKNHVEHPNDAVNAIYRLARLGVKFVFGLEGDNGYVSFVYHDPDKYPHRNPMLSSFDLTHYTLEHGCVIGDEYPVVQIAFKASMNDSTDTEELLQKVQFLGRPNVPSHWKVIAPPFPVL